MARSAFAGIKDAQASRNNRRLDVGTYLVKIDCLRGFTSPRDGKNVFVAELEVVESSNPDFQAGDKVGHVVKEGQFVSYFLGDVKSFLLAAASAKQGRVVAEDELDDEDADAAVSEEQPLRDAVLRCVVSLVTKKNKAGETTTHPSYLFSAA